MYRLRLSSVCISSSIFYILLKSKSITTTALSTGSNITPTSTSLKWIPPTNIETIFEKSTGVGAFTSINRPTAGPRKEESLPKGDAPIQLYSLATPNGQKVGILLEELGIKYDAHVIRILNGAQFYSGFVNGNPNSKIPMMIDHSIGEEPLRVFESASIMLYLAEKYGQFIPKDIRLRTEMMNWIFWQMASQGPMTGNFGHFFAYAPDEKIEARDYGVMRYGMETLRLCDVLDRHLEGKTFIVGEEYTLADIACFPWVQYIRLGKYKHAESGINSNGFLGISKYKNLNAWADRIADRPAVKSGMLVCSLTP